MRRLMLATALATLAAGQALTAGQAMAFSAVNGQRVEQLDANRFIVKWRGQSGDAAFWCAAADYARRGLSLPAQARIWRISEPPRKRGQGIVFSTSPEGAASRTGITTLNTDRRVRADFSVGVAFGFCDERWRPELRD